LSKNPPRLSENSPESPFILGPISLGQDYSRLSENTSSPRRMISRLSENVPESTLALGPFSPRQNWTQEHLSGFQVSSPGQECLAWMSYAENRNFTNELQQFLLSSATMHASDD